MNRHGEKSSRFHFLNMIKQRCRDYMIKIIGKVFPKSFVDINRIFYQNVIAGYKVYKSLLNQYGPTRKIKLLYTGTGDAYIVSSYYKKLISVLDEQDTALLIVGSKAVKRVAELFGVNDAHDVMPRQIYELIKLYVFVGDLSGIQLLHPHIFFRHTGFMAYMEGVHPGMDFAYMVRNIIFNQVQEKPPARPVFQDNAEYIQKLLSGKRARVNNTVLLIPYSTTIKPLPSKFWKALIDSLNRSGFDVFVNADEARQKKNPAIKALFLPYKYAVPVLNHLKCFVVGMRCGFFDVIESANCHMTTLYNANEKRGRANTADLTVSFSLRSMYGRENTDEYIVDQENMLQTVKEIVERLSEEREVNKLLP